MNFQPEQIREIKALANNTPNLKDWAEQGLNKDGNPKQGYFKLDDNRIIKLSDLYPKQRKLAQYEIPGDIEEQAAKFPDLHDCKGFSVDKETGKLKPGFFKLQSGKIISLKKLAKAIKDYTNNIEVQTE